MKRNCLMSAVLLTALSFQTPAIAGEIEIDRHAFGTEKTFLNSSDVVSGDAEGQVISLPGDAKLGGISGPQGNPPTTAAASFPAGGDRRLKISDNNSPFPNLCDADSFFSEDCE